jgi:hypothetical protein
MRSFQSLALAAACLVTALPLARAEAPAPDAAEARTQALEQRVRELENKLMQLTEHLDQEAVERLVQEAQSEARAAVEEPAPEQREFLEGGLALQRLNPEITVNADILAGLIFAGTKFYAGEDDRSGLPLRAVGLHFQHVLDPYSLFKSAFEVSPTHGLEIEEMYLSWFGLVPSLGLTIGRFRQGFGAVNRWHEHDLDQTAYPLALRLVLGEEGLVGEGLLVRWLMPPLWAHANELTFELTDGSNETLFAGRHFSVPSSLLHLKSYWDLSDSAYLEFGLTGMFGFHNRRGVWQEGHGLTDEPWRWTALGGADLTLFWSPPERARYLSITWRSEAYYAGKQQLPGSPTDFLHAWGVYSYLQAQLSARWFVGVRGDLALATLRPDDDLTWGITPFVTFWQSEFVYLRLEYQHAHDLPVTDPEGAMSRRTDDRLVLQINFAAGPHKHEKY